MLMLFAALCGACLGSFASAGGMAWLNDEPLWRRRSVCGHCRKTLAFWQLVPVLSYMLLRGRCAFCGGMIPFFHFGVEFCCALVCCLLAWRYGLQWLLLPYMLLGVALVTAAAIDAVSGLLPDWLTLGSLALLPAIIVLRQDLSPAAAAAGYLAGAGIPLLPRFAIRLWRHKDSLGSGDIKLFALAGAVCGWQALPFIFLVSSLTGIAFFLPLRAYLRLKALDATSIWAAAMPFGPFISIAFLSALLFPEMLPAFYRHIPALFF